MYEISSRNEMENKIGLSRGEIREERSRRKHGGIRRQRDRMLGLTIVLVLELSVSEALCER